MLESTHSRIWLREIAQYANAIGVVVLCTLLRMALDPLVKNEAPFTLYYAGIMLVTWLFSGWGSSLTTIGLSAATGSYFFCEPRGSVRIDDLGHQISLALFVIVGIHLVYLSNLLFRDIARRKIVEADLRRSEEKVRHHQAEMTHAARLSSLGEMAAGLAHELNQPLYALNNYADGCLRRFEKRGEQDLDLTNALRQIVSEANRAVEIVRRVRNFAQKRQLRASRESILRLIEETVSMSQSEFTRYRVAVTCDVSRKLPPVLVDPIQIEQVLINLIRNALEAMDGLPAARRRLSIEARNADSKAVEVTVSDWGKGIAADQLAKIFDPFFTTKPEGMGMGLAISLSIIQAHGGRIWADANPNGGTSFHFILPAVEQE